MINQDEKELFDKAIHTLNDKSNLITEDLIDLAKVYANRANYYINENKHSEALQDLTSAIELLKKTNDNILLAQTYNERGFRYIFLEKYWNASKDFSEAISLLEKNLSNQNVSIIIEALKNRGLVNMELDKINRAEDNYKQALKYYKGFNCNELVLKVSILNGLAVTNLNQKKSSQALECLNEAIEESEKALLDNPDENLKRLLFSSYRTRALAYELLGKFELAKQDKEKATKIIEPS